MDSKAGSRVRRWPGCISSHPGVRWNSAIIASLIFYLEKKERVVRDCRLEDVKNQVTPDFLTSQAEEQSPQEEALRDEHVWVIPLTISCLSKGPSVGRTDVVRETSSHCARCCPSPQVLLSLCCVFMAVKHPGRADQAVYRRPASGPTLSLLPSLPTPSV